MFYFILMSCYLHFSFFFLFPSFGFKFFLRHTKWNVTYRSGNSAQREAGNYYEPAFHFRWEFQNKSPNNNIGVCHYNLFSGEIIIYLSHLASSVLHKCAQAPTCLVGKVLWPLNIAVMQKMP